MDVFLMYKIVNKQILALNIKRIDIAAFKIASRVLPGQFVMVTSVPGIKSIPMSIVEADEQKGTISLIVHEIGPATQRLGEMSIGEEIEMIVGPLGRGAIIEHYGMVICIATGIGAAQILPICRALKKKGNKVIGIIGAKSKKVLMLEAQMRVVCDELFIATNDGSYERKGLASQLLEELLEKYKVHAVYAIGSVDMMQNASMMATAKEIPIWITVNAYMVNGMGLCGSCRVRVNNDFRLACVEGPHFDGKTIDFADLAKREHAFKEPLWDRQNLPSNLRSDGLLTTVKSFLGLAKKKM